MIIRFSKTFAKQRKKAPEKIQKALNRRIELFVAGYQNPILGIHGLNGRLRECYSMNVTGDWRAIFKIINKNEIIFFLVLGTHSQLYKK